MQQHLESFGGEGEPLVFVHANGYPPGAYRALLERLAGHCAVTALRQRPLWGERTPPARLRWELFTDDLLAAIAHSDRPLWLLGHSMGAVVSLFAAARAPQRIRGLLLLDPVFLPTRWVLASRLTPRARLQQMPMIRRALARPEQFADAEAAFDFYRPKRAFAGFSDEALRDYVAAGKEPHPQGGLRLAWSGAWEAAVYASAPVVWHRLARVRLPTLGLRGAQSEALSPAAFRRWGRLQPQAELHTCPGGHLFPLEQPAATAERVLGFLQRHR